MKVYFANCLFSEASQAFNASVVHKIRMNTKAEVFLPQENPEINDKNNYADSLMIAKADTNELLSSDVLVAVLDGPVIDPGVASEIGLFFSTGNPIIGLYTDPRSTAHGNKKKKKALDVVGENQVSYVNLYTIGLIKQRGVILTSSDDLPFSINLLANLGYLDKENGV